MKQEEFIRGIKFRVKGDDRIYATLGNLFDEAFHVVSVDTEGIPNFVCNVLAYSNKVEFYKYFKFMGQTRSVIATYKWEDLTIIN